MKKTQKNENETKKETKAYPPYIIVLDYSDMRDDFEDGDIPEELEDYFYNEDY